MASASAAKVNELPCVQWR